MSNGPKESVVAEDPISTSEGTLGSSMSLSLSESSVRPREKIKPVVEATVANGGVKVDDDKWWLKRPDTRLEVPVDKKNIKPKNERKTTSSPDVSSSMKEFLEKEKFCKAQHKSEAEAKKDKDDTLCDILASTAFDKYPSDFENATDEDIGSFLEEMSKIAGALSPGSVPERTKSTENSTKNPTEEEKSVEELLEEAEKLVRENVVLTKSSSRSEILLVNDAKNTNDTSRSQRLEEDIFHMIEQEVHRETEKIRKSPKNDKKKSEISPRFDFIQENTKTLKPPRSTNLESQKKRFDEHRVEVSSSSDLDDPIDRHSKSEDPTKISNDEKNLQKEITDVDKDFFDDLLRRSKEKMETGGMSGSSSFGQEDFSHFLRILQGSQDRKDQEIRDNNRYVAKTTNIEIIKDGNKNVGFPEKEITEILEKELTMKKNVEKIDNVENNDRDNVDSDSSVTSAEIGMKNREKRSSIGNSIEKRSHSHDRSFGSRRKNISRSCSVEETKKSSRENSKIDDFGKIVNSKGELYTVGLTPRLELFADAIPKLLAERCNEKKLNELKKSDEKIDEKIVDLTDVNDVSNFERSDNVKKSSTKVTNVESPSRNKKNVENREIVDEKSLKNRSTTRDSRTLKIGCSKSSDELAKSTTNVRSSLDDVRTNRSTDSTRRFHQQIVGQSSIVKQTNKSTTKSSTFNQPQKTKLSLKPTTTKFTLQPKTTSKSEIPIKYSQAGGDCRRNSTRMDLENVCRDEKRKNSLLKQQIDNEANLYKQQMQNMRMNFEEELFVLKKQNIMLKAKIDELTLNDRRNVTTPKNSSTMDAKTKFLENELAKQETVIKTYETENKRLIIEMKKIREELKIMENKEKLVATTSEDSTLKDRIKDLQEETLRLNMEITNLREKNNEALSKIDDGLQQESLLREELEMFKEQLKTKNDFINDRLQSMTSAELESRRKTEDLKIELGSKTEQLKNLKIDYEKLEKAVLPLEKELLELRVKDGCTNEKLQLAKSHVEREKQLTLKLKDQVILDNKKILDLNRQLRDMERILKRKNPDSVSALILTAKTDVEKINLEKIKLLEDRLACLEAELRAREDMERERLTELQNKFSIMKEKYVMQVMELETKLSEATMIDKKIYNDMFTQTTIKSVESKSVDAVNFRERSSSMQLDRDDTKRDQKNIKTGPKSQNPKEDAHLIATIRGLKLEIVNKDKNYLKISRELQESQKTNRRLQKEREKLLNDRKNFKTVENDRNGRSLSVGSEGRIVGTKNSDGNDQNSNFCQNGNYSNGNARGFSGSGPKLYDPLQYSENVETTIVKKISNENEILKEELNKINKDFMTLKNKRLHDLNLLQEEHEREMAGLVKEYSVKFGDSKVVKLQGQINTQVAIITHLKQQIDKLRDYKEQVVVLKVEREHLENKVKILNEKVKYLSTPGTEQLQLLQDKITILQQRHESREITLQSLVRDLLRNRTQCRDCKGDKVKSTKQLCYFRQELDNILGMLQEISNVH